MPSKLVRTQVMLDPEVLEILKPEIQDANMSLAKYIRTLMKKEADKNSNTKVSKGKKLIEKLKLQELNTSDIERASKEGYSMRKNLTLFK
jgi:hypothetical protein